VQREHPAQKMVSRALAAVELPQERETSVQLMVLLQDPGHMALRFYRPSSSMIEPMIDLRKISSRPNPLLGRGEQPGFASAAQALPSPTQAQRLPETIGLRAESPCFG
jgi:hypothetical protein